MTVFHAKNYRSALGDLMERRRKAEPGFRQATLAKGAKLQPSYVSNVFAGRADFSPDQLFRVCRFFSLGLDETDYLLLLLEMERCDVPERKLLLEERAQRTRESHAKIAANVSAKRVEPDDLALAQYYLDPYFPLVHVFLRIARYAKSVSLIGEALALSPEKLRDVLEGLEKLGYVSLGKDGVYEVRNLHRHLPDDSPLCLPHQALFRVRSLERLQKVPASKRVAFSVTFAATDETFESIRGRFGAFVKECEEAVKAVKRPARVYQLNFDLFPWGEGLSQS
jgi:uncharacterized protein (TIGR02147 family)